VPRKPHSCIVIGGGLAGLSAAFHLTQKGWTVTLLEAHTRLGGRVLSHRFPAVPELVCELGGEWIGTDHKEMQRLCTLFQLKLLPHRYSNNFWVGKRRPSTFPPGKWCFSKKAWRGFHSFARRFRKNSSSLNHQLDDLDWWTYLENIGFNPDELLRRDLMDSTDFGETIRQVSAYVAATEYIGTGSVNANTTDEMDFKIDGGNDRLICALANAIGHDHIQTEYQVRRIYQDKGGVRVFADRKPKCEGDFCICAVPAHWLKKFEWSPPLPKDQLDASNQLQYARITKTAVLSPKRYWPKPRIGGFSVFTELASDFCFDSTYRQEGKEGILCSYAIGDKADDIAASNEKDLGSWILDDVSHAVSRKLYQPLDVKQQAWQADSFTGGAYAFYRPGQWFRVRPILKRFHRRVHFAGEHLADWQGFMEGAVLTGEAAANAVLRAAP
jgi:monoamine oxidase